MGLATPKEPLEVKAEIQRIGQSLPNSPKVRWDRLNVWYGNKLPQYLWNEWKAELKPRGFTWQKFLKLLKHRTDAVVLWFKGVYSWDKFIRETKALVDGPLGEHIAHHK